MKVTATVEVETTGNESDVEVLLSGVPGVTRVYNIESDEEEDDLLDDDDDNEDID